jgi:hypothetical protein
VSQQSIVIFPGGASPLDPKYIGVYKTLTDEARKKKCLCTVIQYPGQRGIESGHLNYTSALQASLEVCRREQPNWIIARSYGCAVAAGALGMAEEWSKKCQGAVFWGPYSDAAIKKMFPTLQHKLELIQKYRVERNTWLADDFFDGVPNMESLVERVSCSLRFVRGTLDSSTDRGQLNLLDNAHRRSMPSKIKNVYEIEGLEHEVDASKVSAAQLAEYLELLFNPNIPIMNS